MRTCRWLARGAMVVATLVALQGLGQAQGAEFPSVRFEPAVSPLNLFQTEGGQTLPHLGFSAGFYLHYAHRPFELVRKSDDKVVAKLVDYQVNFDLLLALGLFHCFELGVGLPVTFDQSSDGLGLLRPTDPTSGLAAGVGDLRFVPKARILTVGWFTLSASAALAVPTGSRKNLLGSAGVTFTPRVIVEGDFGARIGAAVNLGYRFRNSDSFRVSTDQQHVAVDDEFLFSAGARIGLLKRRLDFIADLSGGLATTDLDAEEVNAELLGGLRVYLPLGFSASVGAGPGLTQGAGTPAFRVFGNLFFQFPERVYEAEAPVRSGPGDLDGDGITDDKDQCPRQPEDLDGFQDADGCPDPDNDGDGLLDKVDRCPLEPEDADGFEDADGCPDADNDKDGIVDAEDKCPLVAEDRDGFEDEDGCPDLDNDNDGILDAQDKCPNDPETFNGVADEDGCPDTGKGPVQISGRRITVPRIYFATGKDVILARSLPVLRRAAELIRDNKWVKKVRVEGHTDSRGADDYNLDLSQRRAASVLRVLTENGVETSRVTSEGLGETQPIASNATSTGRASNRRVDLIITDPAGSSTSVGAPAPADAGAR
ncbi:MAG: OmpA family protein [Proteobacteria bacterium]|nr:OmpA family protein [Pseudomonadota bacterium]